MGTQEVYGLPMTEVHGGLSAISEGSVFPWCGYSALARSRRLLRDPKKK